MMNSDREGLVGDQSNKFTAFVKKAWVPLGLVFVVCALGGGILMGHYLQGFNADLDPYLPPPPSNSILGVYDVAAISTDGAPCTKIGDHFMRMGGTAIDIAVAIQFCTGIVNPHSAGLGGGFTMLYYHRQTQKVHVLMARERAALVANATMFDNLDKRASYHGGLAIATPGEVAGLWEAHQRFGKIPWGELIHPSITLCEKGTVVSKHLAKALRITKWLIDDEPSMQEVYFNPETNDVWKAGDVIYRPTLGRTLRAIAQYGADALYRGPIGRMLVEDIQAVGGVMTMDDLRSFKPTWMKPIEVDFNSGLKMYAPPPPASGAITAFLLNILDNYNFTRKNLEDDPILTYHRIVEAIKFAYARRTELGDAEFEDMNELMRNLTSDDVAQQYWEQIDDKKTYPDPQHYGAEVFNPEDHGTAHFSLLAPNGDAVALTASVNLYFGSMVRSNQTGIILNDQMEDFSSPNKSNFFGLPPSPANFIKPKKRPVSSMSPAVILYPGGDVRLVLGAAGGAKIIGVVSQVLLRNLWFDQDIKEAIDSRRLHHQLFPMKLEYEQGFIKPYIEGLKRLGHNASEFAVGGSQVNAISSENGLLYANADFRKGGTVAGLNLTRGYDTK